jgi:transcriptional regulator GlxA family with amidase domain
MKLPKRDIKRRDVPAATEIERSVGILLLPDFPLMAYACVVEPLRAANTLSGRKLYRWMNFSVNAATVSASNGIEITAHGKAGDDARPDLLLICAGGDPSKFNHPPTLRWLRKLSRLGVQIGGVSGGPYVLGRAGLLDGFRCTIHWEHLPAFVEDFPHAAAERSLFVMDRSRLTCAGGISALDMMHALIEQHHGHDLAAAVSEWFLQTQIRAGSGPQRMSARERFGVVNPTLLRALEYMAARIEAPATREQLAKVANVSIRQLERLFVKHLSVTMKSHYLAIRLDYARSLLKQTSQPILDIAVATGFTTSSHFSREFKKRFKTSPNKDRLPHASPARKT